MEEKKGDLPTGRAHTNKNRKYNIYKKNIKNTFKRKEDDFYK